MRKKIKKFNGGRNYNKLSVDDTVNTFLNDLQSLSKTRNRNVKKND
jgi:hypothetical protein